MTSGVLTKADTLQCRENQIWLPVVKNEKEHLAHGYYVCHFDMQNYHSITNGSTYCTYR